MENNEKTLRRFVVNGDEEKITANIPCGTNANFTNSTNYAKTIILVKLA